jgi:cysteinyl-tRNA synthetase
LLERNLGPAFRLQVLQSHYRAPLTYTEEGLLAAERGLDRLRAAAAGGAATVATDGAGDGTDLAALTDDVDARFHAAMDDDFDTPVAVAALFDLGRAINRAGASANGPAVERARAKLRELAGVFGLSLEQSATAELGPAAPFIDLLVGVRDELRAAKQWSLSDMIRDGLAKQGIAVEDGPTGSTWHKT